jgi:uncharacterized repeat protein (TIGR01451 family)
MLIRITLLVASLTLFIAPWASTTAEPTLTLAAPLLQTATVPPTATLPAAPTMTLTQPPVPTVTVTVPPADTPTGLPTATLPPEATATATSVPTAGTTTPTAQLADLTIALQAPDVVPPDAVVPYTVIVTNGGTVHSQGTSLVDQVPAGTRIEFLGPGCVPEGNAVRCAVGLLAPGGSMSFTIGLRVSGPGTVANTVTVDPGNLVPEANEANNAATKAVNVVFGAPPPFPQTGFPPLGFPPPPPGFPPGLAPPGQVEVAPGPPPVVPIDVAGSQVLPPQAAPGELWLQVLAPTQAFSVDMDPLWVATPGEWYIVTGSEAGWALGVWEADTTGWSVWIEADGRVQTSMVDRADPRIASDVWLVAYAPTEAYSAGNMQFAWMVGPGEWYRVLQHDGIWALAVADGGPVGASVWIQIDNRVELAPGDAPHSPM